MNVYGDLPAFASVYSVAQGVARAIFSTLKPTQTVHNELVAGVAELADAQDLKSCGI